MDSDLHLDELIAPLRDDVVSGAAELGRVAADVLRRAAIRLQAGSLEELRWGLGEVSRRVLDAQPAMAPLVALVRQVTAAVEAADSLEGGRHAAANAADAFRSAFGQSVEVIAHHAAELLPTGGTIATLSSSSTVRALLLAEAVPRGVTVVCLESRPVNEGRMLAEALANKGIEVVYAVDAAGHTLIPRCDAVFMGADSIGDLGIANKIGSTALATAATTSGIPVYVLADRTKILPIGFPQILEDDRPGAEVWDDPPSTVTVWNRYFEITPARYVSRVVTEDGVLPLEDLEARRSSMELPAGLKAWADGRSTR